MLRIEWKSGAFYFPEHGKRETGRWPTFQTYEHVKATPDDSQEEGWYWRVHHPGFAPETDYAGPFAEEALALSAAQAHYDRLNAEGGW